MYQYPQYRWRWSMWYQVVRCGIMKPNVHRHTHSCSSCRYYIPWTMVRYGYKSRIIHHIPSIPSIFSLFQEHLVQKMNATGTSLVFKGLLVVAIWHYPAFPCVNSGQGERMELWLPNHEGWHTSNHKRLVVKINKNSFRKEAKKTINVHIEVLK